MSRFAGIIETAHGPLDLTGRALIMAILNVTPDSFSDGGKYFSTDAAVARGLELAAEGADLLDIGGESTRPGSDPVTPDEQCRRVLPVIDRLRSEGLSLPISIDTRSAHVAAAALDRGADIVNDVSAMRDDPAMPALVAARRVPIVLMHMQGSPKSMQQAPDYTDVVADLIAFFRERLVAAKSAGITPDQVILDPGIGFGKSAAHNWEILRRLAEFHDLGRPFLVGPSRKRFVRAIVGDQPEDVLFGTAATVAACCLAGAHIVRIHDVRAMRTIAEICDPIRRTAPSGSAPNTATPTSNPAKATPSG